MPSHSSQLPSREIQGWSNPDKDRWEIELVFKALKRNLSVETFVGMSANALHIHTGTALIAILLLRFLQLEGRFGRSPSNLVVLHRALRAWEDLGNSRRHQVTELPPIQEHITEYGCHRRRCRRRGHVTLAVLPAEVVEQFGPQLTALIA